LALVILWSFEAAPGKAAEFERCYGPDGDWARLFARSRDYQGTELLRDALRPGRYLTIDRWTTPAAFEAFKREWQAEYEALDRAGAELTMSETPVGVFEV
jgi:heme-degrading monooxygenase HmoA